MSEEQKEQQANGESDEKVRARDRRKGLVAKLEDFVESFLWNFRFVIMLGVIGLLLGSLVVMFLGVLETIHLIESFLHNVVEHGSHIPQADLNEMIIYVIMAVDDFLLGIVLLIFGLGTYDLFISRLDPAMDQDDVRPDWMIFGSLDELKNVLGKIVLMILTINFLKFTFNIEFAEPIHLLYLGGGIALIAFALKTSHSHDINASTVDSTHGRH